MLGHDFCFSATLIAIAQEKYGADTIDKANKYTSYEVATDPIDIGFLN